MRTTKLIPLAAALTAGLLLAGCSADGEPTGASGGDAPTTANVDKAALDTGDYPTTPAPPYATPTPPRPDPSKDNASPSSPPCPTRSTPT